ncbi:MAG: CvpA family protein [Pseudomonadota bacterium]|nr:CvpA family protein [Pseudomonadota bacterium]
MPEQIPVNVIDLSLFVVIVLIALFAATRGFVRELFTIIAWVAAVAVTAFTFPIAKPVLRQFLPTEIIADACTGAFIFIIALVLFTFFTNKMAMVVRGEELNAIDRSLGFVFGIIKGALLVCLFILVAEWAYPQIRYYEVVQTARSMPWIHSANDMIARIAPDSSHPPSISLNEGGKERKVIDKAVERKTWENLDKASTMSDKPEAKQWDDDPETGAGYSRRDRGNLDRLIDSSNDKK